MKIKDIRNLIVFKKNRDMKFTAYAVTKLRFPEYDSRELSDKSNSIKKELDRLAKEGLLIKENHNCKAKYKLNKENVKFYKNLEIDDPDRDTIKDFAMIRISGKWFIYQI